MDKQLITALQDEFNQLLKTACEKSNIEITDHFRDVTKMVV